ncbi:Uncharacterised protein [Mycobacteroides abscessus subsp. abscessus]|nr:Uncharacterised protein [Mycobacteroides abscessus subsp. abscessus]
MPRKMGAFMGQYRRNLCVVENSQCAGREHDRRRTARDAVGGSFWSFENHHVPLGGAPPHHVHRIRMLMGGVAQPDQGSGQAHAQGWRGDASRRREG